MGNYKQNTINENDISLYGPKKEGQSVFYYSMVFRTNDSLNDVLEQSIGCKLPIENYSLLYYLCFSNDNDDVIDIVNYFNKENQRKKKVHSVYELKPSKAGTSSSYETLITIATNERNSMPTNDRTILKKIYLVFEKNILGISINASI